MFASAQNVITTGNGWLDVFNYELIRGNALPIIFNNQVYMTQSIIMAGKFYSGLFNLF